jgi:3(or 17)beta-hydroxysteroid dehydrogenase
MGRVQGKIALITGGGSGLGEADCEVLAREGAQVIVSDIDAERAMAVARRIGGGAIGLRHDASSESDWINMAKEIKRRFGRLDILVNNAGVVLIADVLDTTLEQFRFVNSVMAEGVFLGCKHLIPLLHAGGNGSIVNIASVASHMGFSGFFAYSAAKGAVRSMTKSIAVACQVRGYRIRCNSIHPGSIETSMLRLAEGRGDAQNVPPGPLPMGATGAPSDVANLVLYLASDESRFVTGAEFVIDNGSIICQETAPPPA